MQQNGRGLLVEIDLDRKRQLRVDFNSLIAFKKETGINLLAVESEVNLQDPEILRAFLWAALLWDDPDLTLEQVGNLLTLSDAASMFNALTEAIYQAMPKVSQDSGNVTRVVRARSSNGRKSGR